MRKTHNIKNKFLIFVLSCFIFSSLTIGYCEEIKNVKISKWSAVWRSAVVPGWGQCYLGKMTNDELQIMDNKKLRDKGELIFWGEIVLMMSVVFTGVSSSYVYDKYMAQVTQSEIDKYYNEANLYHKINNWLTIGVLGFHIYNVVDSYFVTRKSNKKSSMLLNNRFGVAVLPDYTQLKFSIRF